MTRRSIFKRIKKLFFAFAPTKFFGLMLSYQPDAEQAKQIENYKSHWQAFIKHNKGNNKGDQARFYSLLYNLEYLLENKVQGHFAEVGVWRGNTAALLAYYAHRNDRRLYLYDTFQGFDRRDLTDIDQDINKMFDNTSIELLKDVIGRDFSACEIREGYFPQTVQGEADEQFSFVSLDADLYQPIREGLLFFYPRLAPGGLIFVHDYGSHTWDGCKKAVDEFLAQQKGCTITILPDKSGTAVIGKPNV